MVKRTFFGPDSSLLNSIVTWPSPACRPEVFPHHLVRTLARPRNPHRGLPAGGLLEMALWTRYSLSKSYANSPDHLSLGQTRFNATLNLPVSHLSQPSLRNRCRKGSWVYKGAHPGAEWESQLRGPSMRSVQIEQKSYEMPPRDGMSVAQFLTVADIERSARYYEKVFGASILTLGDGNAPAYLLLANIWMILNVGGGPTPDKPTVTLSVPDPNHINSFMNFRVADIQACYELWKSRGAEFITEPIPKYGEIRCYIRDPDGYIIEVGQSTDQVYG